MLIFIIDNSPQNIPQLSVKLRKNVRCVWYYNLLEKNTQLRLKKGVFLCVFALIRQFVVWAHVSTFPMRPCGRAFPFVQAVLNSSDGVGLVTSLQQLLSEHFLSSRSPV